ncbi:AMP-binding protein [Streptomyces antimicrobicus]|uniref:AMP-binding protein n=1 Tax=Streptomyces antimicrobicus TaxID=2883108 RepID=A0ABS8B1B0_9ACTN|nr:AMP-binding protein [Streptomyces antimicrobicus]MCB5178392.1 AMP-binding protein [Streptomyces antimicrobicus]
MPPENDPAAGARLLHTAVTRQARIRPHAPALVDGAERVDYRTLDHAADTYATALRALGVGPGDLVPVGLPRGARLIAVLLAVLKCGAGYAALDPAQPGHRLRESVSRLGGPVLVASGALAETAGAGAGRARWAPPQETLAEAARRRTGPVRTEVPATSVASVFFTSGTTGRPKGVLSPHAATLRLFGDRPIAGLGPGRVMAQAAPTAWDAFSLEVWGPLTTGGTCVLAGTDRLLPDDLRRLRGHHGVDTLWLTSALFNLFVDEDVDSFRGLRTVLTGGEALSPAHVRAFLARHPDTVLVNGYGPVESCVFATTHTVRPEDCDLPHGIPIGRPVPGTRTHLVDGEIWLTGDGLAEGYLADPLATRAAFTALTEDGVRRRAYRTGDRGAYDRGGVLHFLGRSDRQVKIAGHRLEPAGIERVAATVPGIRHCHVLPVPGSGPAAAPDHLALFYTSWSQDLTAADIRRALAERLPHYSVPAAVYRVPYLPVTPHGKVDPAALLSSLSSLSAPSPSASPSAAPSAASSAPPTAARSTA